MLSPSSTRQSDGTATIIAAAYVTELAPFEQCRDFVEALRMARHQQQQHILDANARQSIQDQFFLALARARGEQYRS